VQAALDTLKADGFAGASARAIARRGGFNQALVFYHFGTVNDLLLAALDATAAQRLVQYQAALDSVETLPDLLRVAGQVYSEDLDAGHITVLAELMAGATTYPALKAEIAARIEPWTAFTRAALERVLGDSPLAQLLPGADIAFAIVALYLGVEMLTHLDGDRSRADSLFQTAENVGVLFAPLLGGATSDVPGSGSR
jgi:AcrR family transcriptional regulator